MMTELNWSTDNELVLGNYLGALVNNFFKILPMRESGEASMLVYLQSLRLELLGCSELLRGLGHDARLMTLVAILQYFIDNPDASIPVYKREVFKAIGICNKLKAKHESSGVANGCVGFLSK